MAQPLDVKKWITAAIAVFVILSVLEYLANLWILMPAYPHMFPTEGVPEDPMVQRLWIYLGRAIFSVMFVFIYIKGHEGKAAVGEGLRYGLWIILFVPLPRFFGSLVTMAAGAGVPGTGLLVSAVEILICGVTVALIYAPRPQKAAA